MSEHRKHSRISVMQMFHELKQQFPTVPDQVVSDCILKVRRFINIMNVKYLFKFINYCICFSVQLIEKLVYQF